MSLNTTLFVEGIGDQKFLIDLVKYKFKNDLLQGLGIKYVGGKDTLHLQTQHFSESTEQGLTNLLIFDANGSYEDRLSELENKRKELNLQFEIFLFPDNQNSGNLETLLRSIANYSELFGCIDSYRECIQALSLERLRDIDEKAKVYIYNDSFKDGGSSKDKDRDYLNGLWNLDSEYLEPLYKFLSSYFSGDAV